MCGIASFIGKLDAKNVLLDSLSRLEYRGYDSCGLALLEDGRGFLFKDKGRIQNLKSKIKDKHIRSQVGIAHTRWATHGAPTKVNAHPHTDCHNKIFVVHNGIIENFASLKEQLLKEGHLFRSQTDTEVIAHLIEKFYKGDLLKAVLRTTSLLKGSFALAVISSYEPSRIIGARLFSPLLVGISSQGFFLASDIPAFLPYTDRVLYLNDGQMADLTSKGVSLYDFQGRPQKKRIYKVNLSESKAQKQGYKHFMLKEIYEQPQISAKLLNLYARKQNIIFPHLKISPKFLKRIKRVHIAACGTAFHAGLVGKYLLEKFSGVQCVCEVSSEFRYKRLNAYPKEELFLTISQSGETADTLASLRQAKENGLKTLGICNVLGSSLTREADSLIYTHAGPEIGVASTKAYTAQIEVLFLFSLYLGFLKGKIGSRRLKGFLKELRKISSLQEEILKQAPSIRKIAYRFSRFGCFLFLGRNINYPSALEGALKLKEISYIPAEGYPAGEMKHGPIALIDEYRAVVCISPMDGLHEKMFSNIQEIKARRGKVVGVLNPQDKQTSCLCDETIFVPLAREELSPLLVALPLQLFAYYIADKLGHDVDKPRNLAKSVTVE